MTPPVHACLTRSLRALAVITLTMVASVALAQTTPAPAAVPASVAALDSKADCGPKPEHPGKLGSDSQRRAWQKAANAYIECYKGFVTAKQQVAQQYMKAANEAIDQYNATVKEFEAASKGE